VNTSSDINFLDNLKFEPCFRYFNYEISKQQEYDKLKYFKLILNLKELENKKNRLKLNIFLRK
jgi:hypothetical protein